eukprot:TRINITY_DN1360_c0_g1_i1.p2 TRINITY_DN1360_c0_g1~~TRINITY_DN1360_c0_g1_i1.p2  ORF type:complete len:208 (+),score=34.01 TRINITY_DN1360_c0_g1_i1:42-665(+)
MGAYLYMRALWRRKQSDVMRFLQRIRGWELRQQHRIERVTRPTRPEKARQLGYKRKSGYVIFRVRIRRGGRRKPIHNGITHGKPRRAGVTHLKLNINNRRIAEQRAGRHCRELRVLNSYTVQQDSMYKWYEVILVNPGSKAIRNDPQINWIVKGRQRRREVRGKTSAGRKSRGLQRKGNRANKIRPSWRQNWKRRNEFKIWRYRAAH